MVLVDTSVWVEHFRNRSPGVAQLLTEGLVLMHPFIIGELACGNLKDRANILAHLSTLPGSKEASNSEVFRLIEDRRLWGKGIGWVDGHLLASALITQCEFWTLDKKLHQIARGAGVLNHRDV